MIENNFKLMDVWSAVEIPHCVSQIERIKILEGQSTLSNKSVQPFDSKLCLGVTNMKWFEELIVMTTWFLLFSTMLYGPLIIIILLYLRLYTYLAVLICTCFIIIYVPSSFSKTACYHYLATLQLKYFSCRVIWKTTRPPGDPCIGILYFNYTSVQQ